MKSEVKTPVIVAVAILAIVVLGYFLLKTIGGAGNLDQGQVQYTPGKPPWEETDPSKKGPGTSPGVQSGGPTAPGGPPAGAPSAAPPTAPNGAPVAPPGMSAPTLGNK